MQHGVGHVFDFRQRFFRDQTVPDALAMLHYRIAQRVAEKKVKTFKSGDQDNSLTASPETWERRNASANLSSRSLHVSERFNDGPLGK